MRVETENAGRAFGGAMKTKKRVNQGRLTGPVRSKKSDRLSAQLTREPVENNTVGEPDFQVLQVDDAHISSLRQT